jgi:hypothetical protein
MSNPQDLCIQFAKELEEEITAAILAIALDSMDTLEESLWKQQVLCATLRNQLDNLSDMGVDPRGLPYVVGAFSSLRSASDTYAALVQQSRASTDLLLKLCLGYREADNSPHRDAVLCALEA